MRIILKIIIDEVKFIDHLFISTENTKKLILFRVFFFLDDGILVVKIMVLFIDGSWVASFYILLKIIFIYKKKKRKI